MHRNNEDAVSPVVGVMLMLVVTIIIAAVVSAFAGGLGSSQSRIPQVSISAEYSVSNGMMISHDGGDPLTIGDFKILIKPSKNFDSIESDAYVTVINQSLISDGTKMWFDAKGGRTVPRFASGDVAIISAINCSTENLAPSMMYWQSPPGKWVNYGYNQTSKIGATFFLDFVTNDGKRIVLLEVPIKA
jgi:FlaG/FlaF family flagellin (archaellin)